MNNLGTSCLRITVVTYYKISFYIACVAGVRKLRGGGDKERIEGEGTAFSPPTPSPFTSATQASFYTTNPIALETYMMSRRWLPPPFLYSSPPRGVNR